MSLMNSLMHDSVYFFWVYVYIYNNEMGLCYETEKPKRMKRIFMTIIKTWLISFISVEFFLVLHSCLVGVWLLAKYMLEVFLFCFLMVLNLYLFKKINCILDIWWLELHDLKTAETLFPIVYHYDYKKT
jgi:hypothetical protein